LDFLRRDITNVNDFFKKKHVNIFTDWHLFQFIVALDICKGKELEELENLME
jgi:serine/threonine-protein kinase RIO1